MRDAMVLLGTMMMVAGCSAEQPAAPVEEAAPARLAAGQWEVTARIASLRSTDKTTPAIDAKAGDSVTTSACIDESGNPPAALFAAKGDQCTAQNPYVRNGRLNLQLSCTREGAGRVMSAVSGNFTKDGLTGTMSSTSFFTGAGDYEMRQEISGRRTGECTAKVAES